MNSLAVARKTAVSQRTGRRTLHVHIINSPDVKLYGITPAKLRGALAAVARGRRLTLAVSESADPLAVTEHVRDADILVGRTMPAPRIEELPRLRWIHLVTAGVDHLLPLTWLPRRVALTTSSGIHGDIVAEYATCALLMLNIGIPRYATDQRRGRWAPVFSASIRGKTAVIVGLGAMGTAAARQAKRLGLRVLGVRTSRRPHRYADTVSDPGALLATLPRADFVIVAAPLTPASQGMLGRRELDVLKPGAALINVSRARVVDYDALADKLARGEMSGAVLDVFPEEPVPADSRLWRTDNLIMTPHISADAPPMEYGDRVIAVFKKNLARLLAGKPLHNRVDRNRSY